MNKDNDYEAIIQLSVNSFNSDNEKLCVFVPSSFSDPTRTPVYLEIPNQNLITEISLDHAFNTNVQKDAFGNKILLLNVSLIVKKADSIDVYPLINSSIQINQPESNFIKNLLPKKKKQQLSEINNKDILELLNSTKALWDSALFDALTSIEIKQKQSPFIQPPPQINEVSNQQKEYSHRLKKISNNYSFFVKTATIFFLAFLFIFLSIFAWKIIGGSSGSTSQQNALASLQTPQQYVQDQEAMLEQALMELGIDRSQLNNDLSCFTE